MVLKSIVRRVPTRVPRNLTVALRYFSVRHGSKGVAIATASCLRLIDPHPRGCGVACFFYVFPVDDM